MSTDNNTPEGDNPVADIVEALQSVDIDAPEATDNATTIDNNNGERIELGEDPNDSNVVRK